MTYCAPAATPQKRGRKYADVLKGAREVFLRDGFEGASVDDIARAAGVSKATLYSYFPDKRLLFLEIARTECARLSEHAREEVDETAPPAEVLRVVAAKIAGFVTSKLGLGVFRLCVAEGERFPELGRLYYQSGPMAARGALVTYLRDANARGEVRIDDVELAADQFCELSRAGFHARQLFGMEGPPDPAQIARVVDGAVATFLARYGA
jgi:AcrR family transcriptional regulator